MLWEAKSRGYVIHYMTQHDLFLKNKSVNAQTRVLDVFKDSENWYKFGKEQTVSLSDLDIILMRKDPPFDIDYVNTTYLLELAEKQGARVINRPSSLRDVNEKLFAAWFPECCPESIVAADSGVIKQFIKENKEAIIKPLGEMGGASVFYLKEGDPNISVVIETVTGYGKTQVMVQRFIPEVKEGDKRILLIDGEPVEYALARIPPKDSIRANLAAGGTGKVVKLSKRDRWICEQVGPVLKEKGLMFVGLDVIGDYLTEINVTSPTCVREIDAQAGTNICADLFDKLVA